MSTTTIRVHNETREKLKALAELEDRSMQAVLEDALEAYRRHVFIEATNASFARLRSDPQAWKEELEERQAWDCTLSDGLEGD